MNHLSESRRNYVVRRLKGSWQWYLLLLPSVVYLLIFNYGPMYGALIAFKNFKASKGILGSPWVGLKHFKSFLNYPYMWDLIKNTLSITLYSLALFPLPIIFALILNEIKNIKYKKTVQMITYMPHFLTEVVVCTLILVFLDPSVGPVNNLIAALGGERVNFMGIPAAFADVYVWSGMWQGLGWGSILYISALSSVDPSLSEAARIDGANRFQIVRHINIPGILPTITICFIMSTGGLLSVGWSKILLLQNPMNAIASETLSLYTYKAGLQQGQFAYTAAIGLLNNGVNIIILLLINRIVKTVSETSLF